MAVEQQRPKGWLAVVDYFAQHGHHLEPFA
jgi:hypothetical protein